MNRTKTAGINRVWVLETACAQPMTREKACEYAQGSLYNRCSVNG